MDAPPKDGSKPINRSLSAASAGKGTLFPEYDEGKGKRQRPKGLARILDHVKDEGGDGVADVALFLKRNNAARIALKGNDQYPGGDFRSERCSFVLMPSMINAAYGWRMDRARIGILCWIEHRHDSGAGQ
jgi:hypothetical protein